MGDFIMIRRLLLVCLPLLLLAAGIPVDAKTNYYLGAHGASAPPSGFCQGTELFCMDCEEDGQISWTSNFPDAEDCDRYDADGDWCDQDSSAKDGDFCLGVRGSGASKFARKNLTSSASELYGFGWYKTNSGSYADSRAIYFEDNSNNQVFAIGKDSNYGLNAYCNGSTYDAGNDHIPNNTYVFIGYYYKQETQDGNNDGILRVWLNTTGDEFDGADLLINETTVNTISNAAAKIRIGGPYSGYTNWRDNFKVISGSPS